MTITEAVKKTVARYGLVNPGDTIIVAVSGGADSVALLRILCELRYALGVRLHIAHLNHKLRRAAGSDERFVRKLANGLKVPYTAGAVDVRRYRKGDSLEEKAREARMRFLIKTATKHRAQAIATGHTQDDLAETVLMRILRGTGLSGLRAILPKRTIDNVVFIRPLIEIRKQELIRYLQKKRHPFRIDTTNAHTDFFRNKIRAHLLPLLEKRYNPNIRTALASLAHTTATDYDALEHNSYAAFDEIAKRGKGRTVVRLSCAEIENYHQSLRRMLIKHAIREVAGTIRGITFEHIEEIEHLLMRPSVGSIAHLPRRLFVRKNNHYLTIAKRNTC